MSLLTLARFSRRADYRRWCARAASTGTDRATSDEKDSKLPKGLVKQVAILTGSQLCLNLGFSQIVPVMPLFAAEMSGGMGAMGIGCVIAAPSAARLLLNVPLGRVADKVGRKPLMYIGTGRTACGTVLTGLSTSIGMLIPCRLLVGAGSASSMTGSSAYLADLSDQVPEHRAKLMGINQALVGSVWVIGPALGGWLAEMYGFRNAFFVAGAGAALCSLGYTRLPETLKTPTMNEDAAEAAAAAAPHKTMREHVDAWWIDVKPLLASRNQRALIAIACVFPLRLSCVTTVVAFHVMTSIEGAGPKELGFMFTALALSQGLGLPLGTWLADKTTGAKKALIVPAGLLSCAAFSSIAFATTPTMLYAAMAAQGVCSAFVQPAIGAFTAEVTPQQLRGQALGLQVRSSLIFFGCFSSSFLFLPYILFSLPLQRQCADTLALIGPISIGLLADLTTTPTALLTGGCLMAGCHLVYAGLAVPQENDVVVTLAALDESKDAAAKVMKGEGCRGAGAVTEAAEDEARWGGAKR